MTDRPPTEMLMRPRVSRRAALRLWGARVLPMMLLAACADPTSAQTLRELAAAGQAAPPRGSQGSNGQTTARQESIGQPACVLTPQQTEGPYFVDERLNRSDIRSNPADGAVSEGIPLTLTLHVSQVNGGTCTPLSGLYVDLWQCDARGVYSDVQDGNWGTSRGSQFLRGYQVTDDQGIVRFTTIYPGWYRGRTVHIHFKVRTALDGGRQQVSQFYFDDALSDDVFAQAPYAAQGAGRTRNSQDGLFRSGGDALTLQCVKDAEGYVATYHLGVQLA